MCSRCQSKGKSVDESSGVKGIFLGEALGDYRAYQGVQSESDAARYKRIDIPESDCVLLCFK